MNTEELKKAKKGEELIRDRIEEIRKLGEKGKLEQKIIGKRPSKYTVKCHQCKKDIEIAFTGMDLKKKDFICFFCYMRNNGT